MLWRLLLLLLLWVSMLSPMQRTQHRRQNNKEQLVMPSSLSPPKAAAPGRMVQATSPKGSKSQHQKAACTVEKICGLLQKLDRESRRDIIACRFSQQQRLALEQWMKASKPSLVNAGAAGNVRAPCATGAAVEVKAKPGIATKRCKAQREADSVSASLRNRRSRGLRDTTRIGVARHQTRHGTSYSAVVHIRSLEMRTRQVYEKDLAVRFRQSLLEVKEHLATQLDGIQCDTAAAGQEPSEQVAACAQALATKLPSTLRQVLSRHGLQEPDVGLYMRATVARSWFGVSLCGPAFRCDKHFEAGMAGWKQLLQAEEAAKLGSEAEWPAVREAYLAAWKAFGRPTGDLSHRLDGFEARHCPQKRKRHLAVWAACMKRNRQMEELKSMNEKRIREEARAKRIEARQVAAKQRCAARLETLIRQWAKLSLTGRKSARQDN